MNPIIVEFEVDSLRGRFLAIENHTGNVNGKTLQECPKQCFLLRRQMSFKQTFYEVGRHVEVLCAEKIRVLAR